MSTVAQFSSSGPHLFQTSLFLPEMVKEKKKVALVQTSEDFASRTSIHGVAYAFDRGLGLVDRVLWILVVLAFLLLAGFFTTNSWIQWREEQVTAFHFFQTDQ